MLAEIEYESQELGEKIQRSEHKENSRPEETQAKPLAPVQESKPGEKYHYSKPRQPAPGAPCPFSATSETIPYETPVRISAGTTLTYTNYDFMAFAQHQTLALHVCRNREHVRTIQIKRRNTARAHVNAKLLFFNEIKITLEDFKPGQDSALFQIQEFRYNPDLYPDIAENKDWRAWSQRVYWGKRMALESRSATKADAWEDEEDAEDEDAFSNITHTTMPVFIEANAHEQDGDIAFRLVVFLQGHEDEKQAVTCGQAWAYMTADRGATWRTLNLSRTGADTSSHQETWEGRLARTEITNDASAPVMYFFGARDNFGNLTTELPETSPGWPANPAAFFPAAGDMDNTEDVVPASLDVMNTWLARDSRYLYLASRYHGPVTPGAARPPFFHVYVSKFTNPAVEKSEGLMVGTFQAFAPMISYPSELIDIQGAINGGSARPGFARQIRDTISTSRKRQYSVGVGGNVLYSRTDIKTLCPSGCESLRIVFITAANQSHNELMPIPYNCSHYTHVVFRAHVLGAEGRASLAVAGAPGANPPEPATVFFPDPAADTGGHMTDHLTTGDVDRETHTYEQWLKVTAGGLPPCPDSWIFTGSGQLFQGPGPFTIKPGDAVAYDNYRFEAYTRNNRLKVRIFRDGELRHTIMIGNDTKPRRDEQHDTGEVYITLSNFKTAPLSCEIQIRDLRENAAPEIR